MINETSKNSSGGEIKEELFHGIQRDNLKVTTYPNGALKYCGEMKDELFHGIGCNYYPNKDYPFKKSQIYYYGQFENNFPHGEGVLYYIDGGVMYIGGWLKDGEGSYQHGKCGVEYDYKGDLLRMGEWCFGTFKPIEVPEEEKEEDEVRPLAFSTKKLPPPKTKTSSKRSMPSYNPDCKLKRRLKKE